jgi:MFS family permease
VYISLRDRPGASVPERVSTGRRPVARVVVTLGLVSLLTDISSESVAAILPLYLTAVVGLSPIAYGVVDGVYQGVSALVRLGSGWTADLTGRPKWVAVGGYGLSAVARFFLLFGGGTASITSALAVDRVGKGIRTAPRDAIISAEADPAHVARAFGVHRTLDTIGAAVGPLLAFSVLWLIPDGYSTVLVLSFGFAALGVGMLVLFVPASAGSRPRRPQSARPRLRWREVATPRVTRLLVVAGVLGLLTVGDGFVYLALWDSEGFAAHWFPFLYVGTNVAYLALAIPVGRLADRVGRAKVLVVGHLALAAAYLCTAVPVLGAATTVAALLMLGTFYAATDGVLAAVAGRLVPEHLRASGIASAQTVVAVTRMLASGGFGALWFLLGPGTAMLLMSCALLLAVPFAVTAVAPLDRRTVTGGPGS